MNPTFVGPHPTGPPIAILGVSLDNVTTTEAIDRVEQMIASRRPHHVVTANVDFLVQAREDIELRRILCDADLVLCDGAPLVWASRLLGNPLPERVAGADLVPLLVRLAAEKNYRLFFLGGTPASTAGALARLRAEFPQLAAEGYSPPFGSLLEMDHDEIKRRIQEAEPDLLFVSFGCPKQEKWIAMHCESLGVPVCVGVGGTIDFLAGQLKRAPVWMQRTGTEWLFRLAQEPRRLFRRYFKDLWVFGWSILAQWQWLQLWCYVHRAQPGVADKGDPEDAFLQIRLAERLDVTVARNDAALFELALSDERHCLLEMRNVRFIDSTGTALLMRLQRQLRAAGHQLVLVEPSRAVLRALELLRVREFFETANDPASARRLVEARTHEHEVVAAERPGNAPSLVWQGEITADNCEQVWRLTRRQIAQAAKNGKLNIDLSQVRFIDTTALEVMIRSQMLAQHEGVRVDFTGAGDAVRNVLRLAQLENLLFRGQR